MIVFVLCGMLCKNIQIFTETYKKHTETYRDISWGGAAAEKTQQMGRRSSWGDAATGKTQQLGRRSSWGCAVAGEAQQL